MEGTRGDKRCLRVRDSWPAVDRPLRPTGVRLSPEAPQPAAPTAGRPDRDSHRDTQADEEEPAVRRQADPQRLRVYHPDSPRGRRARCSLPRLGLQSVSIPLKAKAPVSRPFTSSSLRHTYFEYSLLIHTYFEYSPLIQASCRMGVV